MYCIFRKRKNSFFTNFVATEHRQIRETTFILAELIIPNLEESLTAEDIVLQFPN